MRSYPLRRRGEPCPAGIEDACPIPRYRCREVGRPGKHCFELFAEFEAFVLPGAEEEEWPESRPAGAVASPHTADRLPAEDDPVLEAVLHQIAGGRGRDGGDR